MIALATLESRAPTAVGQLPSDGDAALIASVEADLRAQIAQGLLAGIISAMHCLHC